VVESGAGSAALIPDELDTGVGDTSVIRGVPMSW